MFDFLNGKPQFNGALCTEPLVDPDIFSPISNQGPSIKDIELSKRICAACSFMQECLAYGQDEPHGTWGGEIEWERRATRQEVLKPHARTVRAITAATIRAAELADEHFAAAMNEASTEGVGPGTASVMPVIDGRQLKDFAATDIEQAA